MWIFEGILYVILLLVFIRYDRKKRLWIKTVSQEEKFEHYLSELSAAYGKQKNIEEAVAEVEESHTVTLPTEHSYVRIYGAMCAVIREDGDMLSDGYSVFQRNLQYLKEEIRENLLLCKSKMHGFTGLDVLSVLPVCFLPVVRFWAVRVSEGLSAYYYGSYGMLTTVLLFAATIGIYGLILWLFLPDEEQKDRYRLEKWLLQFPWMAYLLDVYVSRHYTKCLKKNEQIKQLQGFGNVRAFLMKKSAFCSGIAWKRIVSHGVSECRAFPDSDTDKNSVLSAYDDAGESQGAGKETISGAGSTNGN